MAARCRKCDYHLENGVCLVCTTESLKAINAQLLEAAEHSKATLEMIPRNHFTSRHKASVKKLNVAIKAAS